MMLTSSPLMRLFFFFIFQKKTEYKMIVRKTFQLYLIKNPCKNIFDLLMKKTAIKFEFNY